MVKRVDVEPPMEVIEIGIRHDRNKGWRRSWADLWAVIKKGRDEERKKKKKVDQKFTP